ncbi:MAG: serine hydrolase domain-containing protein [Deltaproteobacteria bacterium]
MPLNQQSLHSVLDKAIDNKKIFGTSFCLKYRGETWNGSSGNIEKDRQFFIASTSKLFTTAVILNLISQSKLGLNDKIHTYFDRDIMNKLHVYNGTDYSDKLTITHLLAHTSGLSDYFLQKDDNGNSIVSEITKGNDRYLPFEEIISYSKSLDQLFAPGTKGKAYYSDTNYQLLGKIIENITGKNISENYNELIIKPLDLKSTYLYTDINDQKPLTLYFKEKELHIPKAMSSFGPDGGVVSTSQEMMIFLEAFFSGKLFPAYYIGGLKKWNKIFFPMQSGIGIHRFRLPWIFDPFRKIPDLIGHSGLSGALAFYSPERDLYITGTVNQTAFNDLSFRVLIKLIRKLSI